MPATGRIALPIKAAVLVVLAVLVASTMPGASAQRSHEVVIQSTDRLELVRKPDDEWYEEGIWPLVGATLAIVLTSAISIVVVHLQAQRSFGAILRQRGMESLAAALNQFYDPLSALLEMNAEITECRRPRRRAP